MTLLSSLSDPKPEDETFVWVFAFTGVVFLGAALTDLILAVSELLQQLAKKARDRSLLKSNKLIATAIADAHKVGHAVIHELDRVEGVLEKGMRKIEPKSIDICGCIKRQLKHLWEHEHTIMKLMLTWSQLVMVWLLGAGKKHATWHLLRVIESAHAYTDSLLSGLLVATDGLTFQKALYCTIITSLSVGYGDVYPVSQGARLAFAFFIPLSVVTVVSSIPQVRVLFYRYVGREVEIPCSLTS
jgi:hypothetical protein